MLKQAFILKKKWFSSKLKLTLWNWTNLVFKNKRRLLYNFCVYNINIFVCYKLTRFLIALPVMKWLILIFITSKSFNFEGNFKTSLKIKNSWMVTWLHIRHRKQINFLQFTAVFVVISENTILQFLINCM